ncbi:hypothetical protein A2U01_0007774 [Trifolium medium]|uniref:Uncharacterized protein n=1 Tax=Trifolium medium TaxID=97028 RepID=A0A392MHE0_9FABA|nr:hypothetical protein [Trifolium medium]
MGKELDHNELIHKDPDIVLEKKDDSATQTNHVIDDVESSDELRQTPVRVLKDMAFLNESWANMVDAEEEEQ